MGEELQRVARQTKMGEVINVAFGRPMVTRSSLIVSSEIRLGRCSAGVSIMLAADCYGNFKRDRETRCLKLFWSKEWTSTLCIKDGERKLPGGRPNVGCPPGASQSRCW